MDIVRNVHASLLRKSVRRAVIQRRILDEVGSTVCTFSSSELSKDMEEDGFKVVQFSTPMVTQIRMIPRIAKNLKPIIWYSRSELRKFAVESKTTKAEEEKVALREEEEENGKIVHFVESVVTAIWVKPRVAEEAKSDLFYSPEDLERFLMECQEDWPKEVHRVRFTQPLITAVEYIECCTEDELALCFYSAMELNGFLNEIVVDLREPVVSDENAIEHSSYTDDFDNTVMAMKNRNKRSLSVHFPENVVTKVRSIPRRTKKETAACFYTDQQLNDFLNEIVESSKNCNLHSEEEFITILQDEIDVDSMCSQECLEKISGNAKTYTEKERTYNAATENCYNVHKCRPIAA